MLKNDQFAKLGLSKFYYSCDFQLVWLHVRKPFDRGVKFSFLKWYYDENHIFSIEAILRHKQVACMRRKMLFTIFKYLFLFQRYSSF